MKPWKRAARHLINSFTPHRSKVAPQTYGEWWRQAAETVRSARIATIDDLTEEQYSMRGRRGDANSPGAIQLLQWTGLPADRTARVLELGCGIARIGREMATLVDQWHGLDISSAMIHHAKARTEHLPNVYLHLLPTMDPAGLARQTFATEPFDMVYCTVVLMHLDKEDLFAYLRALRGLLKPNAPAYFDTWNIAHPDTFRIWNEGAVTGDQKPRGRVQGSTAPEFLLLLHKAGFDIERLDTNDRLLRAVVRNPDPSKSTSRLPYPPRAVADGSPGRSDQGDTFAPFGYVGYPRSGDSIPTGTIDLQGWALDRVTSITVEFHHPDAPIHQPPLLSTPALIHQPRPEVPAIFPEYPDVSPCGWTAQCNLEGLPTGEIRVRVFAEDQEGLRADLAGVDLTFVHVA